MLFRLPPEVLVLLIPVLLFALVFHEFSHGWVANKLGDPTAKYAGRLTLNPIAHLDMMGSLMILFVGFGWAKPVPVDSRYLASPRTDMMKIAFAGPASNLLLAFIAGSFIRFTGNLGSLSTMLMMFTQINIMLAVFNMIPIPPLDGSQIFSGLMIRKNPDLVVKPDLSTMRWYPWFDKTLLVMGDHTGVDGKEINVDPRTILKNNISLLETKGLKAFCASEMECYLLNETPKSAHDKGFVNLGTKHRTMHPETLIRTSEDEELLGPLRSNLELADIPVESVKAEYAPGQIEINLAYTDALAAADRHVIFKTGTKEESLKQNLIATFMAKPWHTFGGSSCHIHLSLVDKKGTNIFAAGIYIYI